MICHKCLATISMTITQISCWTKAETTKRVVIEQQQQQQGFRFVAIESGKQRSWTTQQQVTNFVPTALGSFSSCWTPPPLYPGHPHPDPRPNGHLPQEVRFVKSPGSQFLARFSQASFSDQCDQNFTTEKLALNLTGMQRYFSYFSNVGGISPNP